MPSHRGFPKVSSDISLNSHRLFADRISDIVSVFPSSAELWG